MTNAAFDPAPVRPLLDGPFWFMRHGQSTTNAEDLIAGWLDAPLTDLGHAQAAQAAEQLAALPLASIVVTGLSRTHQTAAPLVARLGGRLTPIVEPGLNERHWGDLEGKTLDHRPSTFYDPPGGETWDTFANRIWTAATTLRVDAPALVVGHSGTFRALLYKMGYGRVRPAVGNAVPVRFVPTDAPPEGGPAWRVEALDGTPVPISPPEEPAP